MIAFNKLSPPSPLAVLSRPSILGRVLYGPVCGCLTRGCFGGRGPSPARQQPAVAALAIFSGCGGFQGGWRAGCPAPISDFVSAIGG